MSDSRPGRADFAHLMEITTRWHDNDAYGHINNVVYYAFFDTAVNRYLIDNGLLDIDHSPVIGLVIETKCTYFQPMAFPDLVTAALRVARLGTSSVTYEIGLYRNDDDEPAALGTFTHVYVDRQTRRPCPLPDNVRAVLSRLVMPPTPG